MAGCGCSSAWLAVPGSNLAPSRTINFWWTVRNSTAVDWPPLGGREIVTRTGKKKYPPKVIFLFFLFSIRSGGERDRASRPLRGRERGRGQSPRPSRNQNRGHFLQLPLGSSQPRFRAGPSPVRPSRTWMFQGGDCQLRGGPKVKTAGS